MSLSETQETMLQEAKSKGRIYSADANPDKYSQSAWRRTARSLEKRNCSRDRATLTVI